MPAKELVGRAAKTVAHRAGYTLARRIPEAEHPYGPSINRIYRTVETFTMAPLNRTAGLLAAVDYTETAELHAAVVECGVWRGGSMMAVALRLMELSATPRDLFLCDTFEGMTKPTAVDVSIRGNSKLDDWNRDPAAAQEGAAVSLEAVQENMRRTGYDETRIHYLKGPVEQTLPGPIPDKISILRLDTDWYESTKHELETLWDRVLPGGVVIVDDYGEFEGARKAVDEFFAGSPVMLTPLDYTARLIVKR